MSPRMYRYLATAVFWIFPTVASYAIIMTFPAPNLANARFGPKLIFYFLLGGFACPWMFAGWWPAMILARLARATAMPNFRCHYCKEVISAVGQWDCGCGYKDRRQRNIFLGRCPKCRASSGYINCPRCDSTILF